MPDGSPTDTESAPQTGFHASFNCLWCGRPHSTRTPDDLEGWAQLCSECVGRAQDNEFLRFRLRDGLQRRSEATPPTDSNAEPDDDAVLKDYYEARAPEYDDFYLGVGLEPLAQAHFQSDLDVATLWLDDLPIQGEIVELAAGTGWWSPLLSQKGELWMYDVSEAVLDRARERLMAHGLRAHQHLRDAYAEPDRQVDALFCGGWLSHVPRPRLAGFLELCRRWLKTGGLFAFIDEAPAAEVTQVMEEHQARRLKDGREYSIVKIFYPPAELEAALLAAGFAEAEVTSTSRFFTLGRGRAG